MDICGEHGDEIAYHGLNCPACREIDDLNKEHQDIVDSLTDERDTFDRELQDAKDELREMGEK